MTNCQGRRKGERDIAESGHTACCTICAMTEIVFEARTDPEGGFTARAVGDSIFTEADTLEELREAIRGAIRCHFEPDSMPKAVRLVVLSEETFAA